MYYGSALTPRKSTFFDFCAMADKTYYIGVLDCPKVLGDVKRIYCTRILKSSGMCWWRW